MALTINQAKAEAARQLRNVVINRSSIPDEKKPQMEESVNNFEQVIQEEYDMKKDKLDPKIAEQLGDILELIPLVGEVQEITDWLANIPWAREIMDKADNAVQKFWNGVFDFLGMKKTKSAYNKMANFLQDYLKGDSYGDTNHPEWYTNYVIDYPVTQGSYFPKNIRLFSGGTITKYAVIDMNYSLFGEGEPEMEVPVTEMMQMLRIKNSGYTNYQRNNVLDYIFLHHRTIYLYHYVKNIIKLLKTWKADDSTMPEQLMSLLIPNNDFKYTDIPLLEAQLAAIAKFINASLPYEFDADKRVAYLMDNVFSDWDKNDNVAALYFNRVSIVTRSYENIDGDIYLRNDELNYYEGGQSLRSLDHIIAEFNTINRAVRDSKEISLIAGDIRRLFGVTNSVPKVCSDESIHIVYDKVFMQQLLNADVLYGYATNDDVNVALIKAQITSAQTDDLNKLYALDTKIRVEFDSAEQFVYMPAIANILPASLAVEMIQGSIRVPKQEAIMLNSDTATLSGGNLLSAVQFKCLLSGEWQVQSTPGSYIFTMDVTRRSSTLIKSITFVDVDTDVVNTDDNDDFTTRPSFKWGSYASDAKVDAYYLAGLAKAVQMEGLPKINIYTESYTNEDGQTLWNLDYLSTLTEVSLYMYFIASSQSLVRSKYAETKKTDDILKQLKAL